MQQKPRIKYIWFKFCLLSLYKTQYVRKFQWHRFQSEYKKYWIFNTVEASFWFNIGFDLIIYLNMR